MFEKEETIDMFIKCGLLPTFHILLMTNGINTLCTMLIASQKQKIREIRNVN